MYRKAFRVIDLPQFFAQFLNVILGHQAGQVKEHNLVSPNPFGILYRYVLTVRLDPVIKILKPLVVGDMYIIKLKQTSKKGFSVRATGSLSKKGIPEKTNKAKNHQELYSRTPIRFGIDENINTAIGVDTKLTAKQHLFYRTSVTGRRKFGEQLMTNIKVLDDFDKSPEFKNRNVEILQAYLKAMGIKIIFDDEFCEIPIYTNRLQSFKAADGFHICTDSEFEDIERELDVRKKYSEERCFVGTNKEFEDLIKEEIKEKEIRNKNYVIDIK
jgi:hypothetical protein